MQPATQNRAQADQKTPDDTATLMAVKTSRRFLVGYYGSSKCAQKRVELYAAKNGLSTTGAVLPMFCSLVGKLLSFSTAGPQLDTEDMQQSEEHGTHGKWGGIRTP